MKQSDKKGTRNVIGGMGEEIAVSYLKKQGFTIIEQNYFKKWGEIDVVARETLSNNVIVHFVEVKTVSYETKAELELAISRGTYRPEEQVHQRKLQKLHRTIESWIQEHDYNDDWQIDIVAIRIVPREKYASVKMLPNVIV